MTANRTGTPKDSHYARLRRARRDQAAQGSADRGTRKGPEETVHLYGLHAVKALLGNPQRRVERLLVTQNALNRLDIQADSPKLPCPVEIVDRKKLDRLVGPDAVHQGVVAIAYPLVPRTLEEMPEADLVLVLDQVTDPHNVGAIVRSCAAFDAGALITTARHSPRESGVLAKSASGALEHVEMISVRNLAASLEQISANGIQTIGLDSQAGARLEDVLSGRRIALVLGAEGKGLRQKTARTVDQVARLDIPGAIKSLNVSNAAAISLYVARNFLRAQSPAKGSTQGP